MFDLHITVLAPTDLHPRLQSSGRPIPTTPCQYQVRKLLILINKHISIFCNTIKLFNIKLTCFWFLHQSHWHQFTRKFLIIQFTVNISFGTILIYLLNTDYSLLLFRWILICNIAIKVLFTTFYKSLNSILHSHTWWIQLIESLKQTQFLTSSQSLNRER